MFQSATLQSLMIGNYDGYISVAEFRSCGDIGLGTFGRVDGEMIVLDGTVFQAKADGNVVVADDGVMVPFAAKTDVRLDLTPAFNLYLPEEESFANADLAKDLSSEIESVEK